MLNQPRDRQDIIEEVHNEIVKIIVEHRLLASDIILILELIKSSILNQLSNRYYVLEQKKPTQIQGSKPAKTILPNKTEEVSKVPEETKSSSPENPSTN